ncbi:hypothetical protein Sta7437_0853 [Stanieria cyanosphaera PCC 7437]|uniref:Uncharacterized protein n=1 Tax=Stanieria cyanosphaera (strain ATCC 29371 / PCC 7437) TaxID=111780 RepID=K9XP99_STAC7|nr:hypothetical protein [Stanieria cyanosphaera]AFZ34440.1 hypothetical protein Sta7437_0853 [Stanieria cyanosphaera PCC 7437]
MEVKELKLLLKLLGKPDYHGTITELEPSSKTKITEVESICRKLRDRNLIECQEELIKIKLSPSGKALLKLNSTGLPLNHDESTILTACAQKPITPQIIKITPVSYRQQLVNSLIKRGLIVAATTKIKQVYLTEQGKEYLIKEYNCKGHHSVLSLDLLNNYLYFLRKFFLSTSELNCTSEKLELLPTIKQTIPTDEDILKTIIDLDRELGTDNYLPIFYLREKLQPPLSREELDASLYRLQKQDKLELSSLLVAENYSQSQINAGIPQTIGGRLFFLIVN